MKGLLTNNYYATVANAKIFSIAMVLLCALAIVMKNLVFFIGFMVLCMIGFSLISIAGLRRDLGTKWNKYKLTVPVRRTDIIRSYYLSLILWLLLGMIIVGSGVACSIILRSFILDLYIDIYNMYVFSVGVSLFIGAVFFPLFFSRGGEDRNEALLAISILCGNGIVSGMIVLMNRLFSDMTDTEIIIAGMIILTIAMIAFVLSYILTIRIYRKRDY